ncbi:hypothetical protein N9597_01100 [Candidatus Marinimicrobia bacterium]|mgnify:CR=1 FL=1|nr:hypothetical protein [Candidatus Neomarinimicrobiota bacterium]
MINKNLLLICAISLFLFTCDNRVSQSEEESTDSANVSTLQVFGSSIINVIDLEQPLITNVNALPLDQNGVFLSEITIDFEILNDGPGYLSDGSLTTDTTAVVTQFNIIPAASLTLDNTLNFIDSTIVKAYVNGQPNIYDSIIFRYENGGVSADVTALEISNDTTSITAYLSGDVDGISTGIEGKWIHFESLLPDGESADDASSSSTTFGEMNPEYAQTNVDGIAMSTFAPLNQTGFANLKITWEELTDETYIQIGSGDGISLEIIVPTNNDLMVTGGGGNESVSITAEIKDGFGNYVDEEYAVIFTVPCPFPIDGQCPVGDGDRNNDIKLNGYPSIGNNPPTATALSTNGIANVTLNSGNRPGLVSIIAELCTKEDIEDNDVCDNVLFEASKIAAAISTGPAKYGKVVAGWTEADSTGGGIYSLPVTAAFWDQWTNPIADSTSVYWYINPEYIATVDPESKIGNCGSGEPGQACTNAYYTSGDIFSQGQICAAAAGEDNLEVLACSGGARCEDFSEVNCRTSEDIGCVWNEEFDECYFKTSEAYCNTLFFESQCTDGNENYLGYPAPYDCTWTGPNPISTGGDDWQALINEGASCHYRPVLEALDQQPFSYDADGDGQDDQFTGEYEAVGNVTPDDPFCNVAEGFNALQYQEQSDECESNSVCSWEFIAGDATSEDGSIGSCVYNGGSGYYNPCVDCEIELIPLSPTVTDYCSTNDAPLDVLVRGHLGDAYGDDVHLGNLLMAVFDATAFEFVASDAIDVTIDTDMGYDFDPPIPASAAQQTDSNGEVYWIVRIANNNCRNTNPDDPDAFTCDNPFFRAFLLDPLNGESTDLNTTLYKECQP